ncbi:C2H2-type zinc finger protein [Endozoicomonas ascidiicola]|uniref:C2H2-type zinc finger protein n=1 Tax=Endozoicomonas ascidiicola TaxID=1698521 RepID=UPI00083093C5|nr:C2H2-type zinc finger protein [Endozoicomonas ascidiicola]
MQNIAIQNTPKIKSLEGIVNKLKEKVEPKEIGSTFDRRTVAIQSEPLDLSIPRNTVAAHTKTDFKQQESVTKELEDRNVGVIFNQQTSKPVSSKKKHKCQTCDKVFNRLDYLKEHVRIHTGEKPYSCKVCKKSFTQNRTLKTHALTHTGEKPHKCETCDKSFSQKCNLKTHALTHTGKKPYKCKNCDKAFSQLGNLKTHALTHTGEKPHKCETCDKAFSHKISLTRHMTTH